LVDRWEHRAEAPPALGAVYWHVLVGRHPEVRRIAEEAQERLSDFVGLHRTPVEWLHITTLVAGTTNEIARDEMKKMVADAALSLSKTPPITISLGRILYHPEAIVLKVKPDRALDPVLEAARSTVRQPAEPIIAALGKKVPDCEITIDALSLVIQRGPERLWDWHPVGTAYMRGDRYDTRSQNASGDVSRPTENPD
jgi:hypothetical protein